ncbi:MAG: DUF1802 family protein [Cylindrospermopsis raciborskii PAMP2012]|uniref:DUF1802 family protein n=1 Tax=Cylindrospermopsis raciborskii TaxID=77022 RepID=UPI000778EC5E|nr:DUF1802 family protein [Cylindrospermopsis raciborskii]MCZ2202729.1 DUF1802 family protein [Cylindrospermopsis raciborskii PAMP2012]
MSKHILIYNALCLPEIDIEHLIKGRIISVIPQSLMATGQAFALFPAALNGNPNITNPDAQEVLIKCWARCQGCEILHKDKTGSLDILAQLTIREPEFFQQILEKRPHFFLAHLRVYYLDTFVKVKISPNIGQKLGKFIPLESNIYTSENQPVLDDYVFLQRQKQLENRQPPLHPQIEKLDSLLSSLVKSNPEFSVYQQLQEEIRGFLGWSTIKQKKTANSDLDWIKTISFLADRSIELEERKSNYQAGTDFENICRRGLEFLGFRVENSYKGGVGGLDLYCSDPFPLVCECKSGKSIPDRAVEELDRIAKRHLQENYLQAVRLIIGPGGPTKQLQQSLIRSAKFSKTSIMKAMTLQKLVQLKATYPGAVNLLELKEYLEPGQIDDGIDEYIEKVEKQIKIRSHLVRLVKEYLRNSGLEFAMVGNLHGVYFGTPSSVPLKLEEMHEILIELSSPLTGYLGRKRGTDWKTDQFYYLRDLIIMEEVTAN